MTDKERKSCIHTIELLRRLAFNVHGVMDVIDAENCDKIIKMLEADAQRWIPCSERLPKTHETGNSFSGIYMQSSPVLVYGVPEYEEEYGFHVVTYCDDKNGCTYWSTELDAVTINKVYAWMPLPEPWKGEQP